MPIMLAVVGLVVLYMALVLHAISEGYPLLRTLSPPSASKPSSINPSTMSSAGVLIYHLAFRGIDFNLESLFLGLSCCSVQPWFVSL